MNQYIKPNIQFSRIKLKSNDTGATFSIPDVPLDITEEQFLVRGSFSTTDLLDCEMGVDKLNKDLYIRIDDEIRILNTGENNTYTSGNGITIGTASTIDLGGDLTGDVIINGNSYSMYIGNYGPDTQLTDFSVGVNNGMGLYSYDNNQISSGINLGTNVVSIGSNVQNGNIYVTAHTAMMGGYDNRKFSLYLYGSGIPTGSGEYFVINGVTFSEGVDFIGQGDPILDTESIAGLTYSGVVDFISLDYTIGSDSIFFNFSNPAVVSASFSSTALVENQFNTQLSLNTAGAMLVSGNNGLVINNFGEHKFNDTEPNPKGLQYAGNYDATLVNDSLVPKRYVDNAISTISLTGGSGISIGASGSIDLGGTLNQPTIIEGNSQTFDIGTTASPLSFLRIESIQSTQNYKFSGEGLEVTQNPGTYLSEFDYSATSGYKSFIQQSPNVISTVVNTNSAYEQTQITQSPYTIDILTKVGGGASSGFTLNEFADSFLFTDNRLTPRGLEYGDDYSANFSVRSLIDKGYLDSVVSGLTDLSIYTTNGTIGSNRVATLTDSLQIGNGFNLTDSILTMTGSSIMSSGGSTDTLTINHTSGSGHGVYINKSGAGDGLHVVKSSGSGSAVSITGGSLDMNTQKIIDVLDPTNPQDVATKNYVDTSSPNFANTNLTFTGDRNHQLNGNDLDISNGANVVFRINEFNDVLARGKGDSTNTHFGLNVLRSNSTGVQNTVFGQDITGITSGQVNAYFGYRTARFNNGTGNSFFGGFAGLDLTTGNNNVIIGRSAAFSTNAGGSVTNLENSIVIGETARVLNSGDTNTIVIGRNSRGLGSNTVVLGNSDITRTQLRGRVEMDTTTDGILLPRLTTAQMNAIAAPVTNTILYNTDLNGLYRYNGSSWVALSSGYGIIGVYSSGSGSGIPTFFATLQDALETCKTSGGYFTVKLYSNITITSSILIDYTGSGVGGAYLFRQLTIDLNGFSITNAQANTSEGFDVRLSNSASVYQEIRFINGTVLRTNGTGTHHALKCDTTNRYGTIQMNNMYWYCQNNHAARIGLRLSTAANAGKVCDLGGSVFVSNGTQRTLGLVNSEQTVTNFSCISTSSLAALYLEGGVAQNFYVENTSTGQAMLQIGGIANNFITKSNGGVSADISGAEAHNFIAKSTGTNATAVFVKSSGLITNFKCDAADSHALQADSSSVVKNGYCQNNSATRGAIQTGGHNRMDSVEGVNLGASYGGRIQGGYITKCKFISVGGIGAELISFGTNGLIADDCYYESRLNTSSGHACRVVPISGGTFLITKSNFVVTNSGANCLLGSTSATVNSRYSTHNDIATTPINANVTIVSSGIIS